MGRIVLGVVVGYVVWTALWLGGNAAFFGDLAESVRAGQPATASGPLVAVLALSVVCSLAGGWISARLSSARAKRAAIILGVLLLATGIGVQASAWSMMPVWYHLTFLALLVPVTMMGSKLSGRVT